MCMCVYYDIYCFIQELELIEDNWQEEVKELLKNIDQLQRENQQYRNLRETLKEQQKLAVAEALAASKSKFNISSLFHFSLLFFSCSFYCLFFCLDVFVSFTCKHVLQNICM